MSEYLLSLSFNFQQQLSTGIWITKDNKVLHKVRSYCTRDQMTKLKIENDRPNFMRCLCNFHFIFIDSNRNLTSKNFNWYFFNSAPFSLSVYQYIWSSSTSLSLQFIFQYICTLTRARRIILACWIFALCYSSPWLVLTTIKHSCVKGYGQVSR